MVYVEKLKAIVKKKKSGNFCSKIYLAEELYHQWIFYDSAILGSFLMEINLSDLVGNIKYCK